MTDGEKKGGFIEKIKDGLHIVSQIISATIFPQIIDGVETVMKNIDNRILAIETRILRKISSLLIICFGAIILVSSLFFVLIDYAGWSRATALFSIGITIFVIGLLFKVGESGR